MRLKRLTNQVWPRKNCFREHTRVKVEKLDISRSELWLWAKKWAWMERGQERQFSWKRTIRGNNSPKCQLKNLKFKLNEWWPKLSNFFWQPKKVRWRFSRLPVSCLSTKIAPRRLVPKSDQSWNSSRHAKRVLALRIEWSAQCLLPTKQGRVKRNTPLLLPLTWLVYWIIRTRMTSWMKPLQILHEFQL